MRKGNYRCWVSLWVAAGLCLAASSQAWAQHDHDHQADASSAKPKPPRVFLDKSPRIVEYQLKRLSNEQLLLIETEPSDAKFDPVYMAILTREGMARSHRDAALAALVTLRQTDPVTVLADALAKVDGSGEAARQTRQALARMLLSQPPDVLAAAEPTLQRMLAADDPLVSGVAYAALIVSGHPDQAWQHATAHERLPLLLANLGLVEDAQRLAPLFERTVELASAGPASTRAAAILALKHIPGDNKLKFKLAAAAVQDDSLRDAAVQTLLTIPREDRDPATSLALVDWLVGFAERTPAADRTSASFLDAMELVEQLLPAIPADAATAYRQRLRNTVVRVVRIRTVEEEMRYDTPYFAVEAGRPVQVVLINEDLMPHNLVITVPGALKEVAELGLQVGPTGGKDGKQYVPDTDKVLFATHMVPAHQQETLTFTAPEEPGEYPYVCTFPRHWMRMYGVMVVVKDLDAWLRNPVEPKDPVGSNRAFVQSWTIDDFPDLETSLRGRSMQIGEKLFVEATCAQCHKLGPVGVGNVGPELSGVFAKYKGDARTVLQEILDPSHRIDDKYAVHMILDVDGKTHTGLVVGEDQQTIRLLENPESTEPTVIAKEDIEEQVKTSNSMMPKGLLDRFSQDEILEILAFIQAHQAPPSATSGP
ncbi:MAG: hypothetical protein D6753_14090 [Planctomycetota bacterium]|nr:MAG: hypothetical protein D6753_14090 [Planctomycetota bacterium]